MKERTPGTKILGDTVEVVDWVVNTGREPCRDDRQGRLCRGYVARVGQSNVPVRDTNEVVVKGPGGDLYLVHYTELGDPV